MSIGSVLAQKRKAQGMKQTELAAALVAYGIQVSHHAVTRWETDKVIPNARQFLALCRILGIRDVLGEFCGEGGVFDGLNREGRERVLEYAKLLRSSGEYGLSRKKTTETVRLLPLYDLAVSAGTGQFLDGENYEMVECGIEVPEGANFGVRIAGNSMEPRYHDGQTIWVRQQRSLLSGEIGIFLYDGDAYLKKLVLEDGQTKLHSLNPDYQDIIVSTTLPLRVLGKVLSP